MGEQTASGPRVELTEAELREGLSAALAVPRWVDDVVAAGPYRSLPALLESAEAAASPLSTAEVDQALAHHPRIGDRPVGESRSSTFSRAEQADSASDDPDLTERLLAGNRAYEERFGRVFLIRAAGRDRAEVVAELERRLGQDEDAELAEVAEQLRQIALLRLAQLFPHLDHHSGYDDPEAAQ